MSARPRVISWRALAPARPHRRRSRPAPPPPPPAQHAPPRHPRPRTRRRSMAHSTPKKGSNGTFTPFTPDAGAGSRARRARRARRGRCGQRCPARLRHPDRPRHSRHATSLLPHTRHPCPTPRSRQCIKHDVHYHPRSDLVFLITFVSTVPGCVTQCGTRLVTTIPVPHWVTGAGCGPGTGRGQGGLRDASDGLARAVEAR